MPVLQEAEEGSRKGSLNQDLLNHGDSSHQEQGSKTSSDEEDTFEGQINLDKVNLISKHDPEDAQDDSELKMNRQDISCPDTTERESTNTLICQKAEQTRDKLKESTTLQMERNSKFGALMTISRMRFRDWYPMVRMCGLPIHVPDQGGTTRNRSRIAC